MKTERPDEGTETPQAIMLLVLAFTLVFPVVLSLKGNDDVGDDIREVRMIQAGSLGLSVSSYLCDPSNGSMMQPSSFSEGNELILISYMNEVEVVKNDLLADPRPVIEVMEHAPDSFQSMIIITSGSPDVVIEGAHIIWKGELGEILKIFVYMPIEGAILVTEGPI